MFRQIVQIFKSKLQGDHQVVLIFIVLSILLFSGAISNFKLLVAVFMLSIVVIFIITKNIFLSVFLHYIFSLFFLVPNKYYAVEIMRAQDILLPIYQGGYKLGYGLTISSLLSIGLILTLIREQILNKKLLPILKKKQVVVSILLLALFFLTALGGSLQVSPFIDLSLVWLLHYMQLPLVAVSILYFYNAYREKFYYFQDIMLIAIGGQILLSILQFAQQSYLGLPIEYGSGGSFYTGLDENNALFRVGGSLLHANQLGLLMTTSLIMVLDRFFPSIYYQVLMLAGAVVVVLTQSRSSWIALGISLIWAIFFYKHQIQLWLQSKRGKKIMFYSLLIIASLSYILLPRILLSLNTLFQGGGGYLRLQQVADGWEVLKQRPILGHGVGMNEYALYKYLPTGIIALFPAAIHQGYLQLALEVGLVGLLFFIAPFIFLLRKVLLTILQLNFTLSKKSKRHVYIFLAGVFSFGIYYIFLPHIGIVEFPFLGMILGYGLIAYET